MIYQHRLVLARSGRLEKRHVAFQETALAALDGHGSVLIGAWEVWVGPDAGGAVYQMRQFNSLADWEQHQERVRQDNALVATRNATLYPHLDYVETAIVRMADGIAPLTTTWPSIESVRGQPTGIVEQRILHFRPGRAQIHHGLYREQVLPALEADGVTALGLFDTVIGPGTSNANSHRSVELRRFDSLATWERWRSRQDTDAQLRQLMKTDWLQTVERVDSVLMRPLDYSRMR